MKLLNFTKANFLATLYILIFSTSAFANPFVIPCPQFKNQYLCEGSAVPGYSDWTFITENKCITVDTTTDPDYKANLYALVDWVYMTCDNIGLNNQKYIFLNKYIYNPGECITKGQSFICN